MSSDTAAQSTNAAANKAKLRPPTRAISTSSKQKFSAAGQPAGTTSSSKMLGENRYNSNPSETTTDLFASVPRFPDKHISMDGDERSSITSASDNDDTVMVSEDGKLKPAPGKKTRGRVKIQMEYIQNKLRRYTTFSKRKSGIMKKAYELSTLTGTQVMLLVASETGHVYTFATPKLQPMITSEAGKALIQTCLHQPDPPTVPVNHMSSSDYNVRMSSTGYEETDLGYNNLPEEDFKGGLVDIHPLSTAAQMPTILGAGPIVTIPHGMMQMPSYSTSSPAVCESQQPLPSQTLMAPLHQLQPAMQPMTSSQQVISPHHSPPPPTYSPPHHQPTSPQRTYTPTSYPGSPPTATPYSQPHQVMMHDELGSPMGHHGIENYERSPSRSPIRYSSPHHVHSPPQAVYSAPHGSPPMAGHSPILRI